VQSKCQYKNETRRPARSNCVKVSVPVHTPSHHASTVCAQGIDKYRSLQQNATKWSCQASTGTEVEQKTRPGNQSEEMLERRVQPRKRHQTSRCEHVNHRGRHARQPTEPQAKSERPGQCTTYGLGTRETRILQAKLVFITKVQCISWRVARFHGDLSSGSGGRLCR
jgi:hypothetical protein